MRKSQEFLSLALQATGTHQQRSFDSDLLSEAKVDFGVSKSAVQELLDRKNWTTTSRPQVIVNARQNRSGNLTVKWYPAVTADTLPQLLAQTGCADVADLEFDPKFLGWCASTEAAGGLSYRPGNEIMWFRGAHQLKPAIFEEKRDVLAPLLFGLKARYEELLADLGDELTIVQATTFTPIMKDGFLSDWKLQEPGY